MSEPRDEAKKCQQYGSDGTQCVEVAAYRYTWPGGDESYICMAHSGKLQAVAHAMGLHLQLIRLEERT